jgi:predicted  nucleic acid-binding Zn-ribbon protein
MGPQSDAEESTPDSQPAGTEPPAESSPDAEDPSEESSLDQLRKELNDQFESIRIVSPGQYELNLMELYDRDEYIISLREDGRYVIEVPDGWGDS